MSAEFKLDETSGMAAAQATRSHAEHIQWQPASGHTSVPQLGLNHPKYLRKRWRQVVALGSSLESPQGKLRNSETGFKESLS